MRRVSFQMAVAVVAIVLLVVLVVVRACGSSPVPVPHPNPSPTSVPTVMPQPKCSSPLIPLGQLPAGTKYSTIADGKGMPTILWMGIKYEKQPGVDGRLWGHVPNLKGTAGGNQTLLYGQSSAYCPARK